MVKLKGASDLYYLIEASKLLSSTHDYNRLLTLATKLTTQAMRAEASCLFLVEHKRKDKYSFGGFYSWNRNQKAFFDADLCKQLADKVVRQGRPYLSNSLVEDSESIQHQTGQMWRPISSVVCVPLKRHNTVFGALEALNKVDGAGFASEDLEVLQALADLITIAIDNARLYRRLRQEAKEKNILLEVGRKILSSLNLNEVLNTIVDSLLEVVHYDAAAIFLIDPETQMIREVVVKGYPAELEQKVPLKIGEGIVGWAIKTGKAVIVPDVTKDQRYINARPQTRSELAVPISSKGRIIGAFNLESDELDAYDQDDRRLVEAFSHQAAISIEMAELHRELLEKQRLKEELAVARRIQLSFLPQRDPDMSGFEVSGLNFPSEEIGGDYYDFIRITDNDWGIAVGDVVGKGVPAALIMASFRASLIAELRNNYSIGTIMTKVNRLLFESTQPNEFVTAFYGVINCRDKILTYANAGHNYPLLRRADGSFELLTQGGQPLGLFFQNDYSEYRVALEPGAILVLYTDGVVETTNPEHGEFGVKRLQEVIERYRHLPARALCEQVYAEVKQFRGDEPQQDDITIVAIKSK